MNAYFPPLPLVLGAALIVVAGIVALITRTKRQWLSHVQRKPLLPSGFNQSRSRPRPS